MTNQHPVNPSPELVQQWDIEGRHQDYCTVASHIAARAAQWGADQELEACCAWFQDFYKLETWMKRDLKTLCAARRPRPPSLKEQALLAIDTAVADDGLLADVAKVVRRALESLPND
jgi:hypothetical protein